MNETNITDTRAVEIARQLAHEAYGPVDTHTISVTEAEREWRVRFELPSPRSDGGASHFAVWVDKRTGEARVFRGR